MDPVFLNHEFGICMIDVDEGFRAVDFGLFDFRSDFRILFVDLV